jgi:hypothetical protein
MLGDCQGFQPTAFSYNSSINPLLDTSGSQIERYAHALAGVAIAMSGIMIKVFGL